MSDTRAPELGGPDGSPRPPPVAGDPGVPVEGGRVWIVDDSPLEAEMANRAISPKFATELFSDGATMLERLANDDGPDALVLDWQLPGMSGIEVCRFLRGSFDEIALPIVMLTVHGHKQDIVEGLAAGANDYLTKPYDPTELLARVGTLVRTRKLHERAKRAEKALFVERDRLLQSEHRFRTVAEAIPQMVWTTDPAGALDYCNQGWIDYTGMSLEQVRGSGWTASLHPDDKERTTERWRASVEKGDVYETQYRLQRADGVFHWFLARGMPLRDARGRITKWFGTSTDIDEQKRTEAQIDALLEGAPVGIGFLDRDLRFVRVNEALAAAAQVPKEAVLGRMLAEVLPEAAPALEPIFRRVIETGEPITTVDLSVRAPGTPSGERHFLASYYPVRVGGQTVGLAAMMTDITERKRAGQALDFLGRASVALISSLDSTAACESLSRLAVPALADWCGVYLRDDGEGVRLTADSHEGSVQLELLRLVGMGDRLASDASFGPAKLLRTGKPELVPSVEEAPAGGEMAAHCEALRRAGVSSWMMAPLAVQNRIFGWIALAIAGSGRRYDEADLSLAEEIGRRTAVAIDNARLFEMTQRERARVEEANHAKDEFLATVSHELRTPLNAILGWAVMLRSGAMSDEKRIRAVETIERNARSQTQLIEDLLDISRIVSGKLRLNLSPVQPLGVVEAAIDTVRPAAEAKGVKVLPALEPHAGPIMADPERLQQVVWNLLSNAVKFTPKGGRVSVRMERAGSDVEIAVTDTGRGMAPQFLPYVFERFRQADMGIARMHGGLGLGLAITRHLVELHGGGIEATSPGEGLGSTFTVRIPLATSVSMGTEQTGEPERVVPGSLLPCPPELVGLRVLVVEDEQDARDLMASVLERCRSVVTTAATAAEALDLVRQAPPDVIVSDVGMPGESGYDLIRKVRLLPPEQGGRTPAVALTAYARMEDRTRALVMGFDMHVPKPIEPSELLVVIAHLASRFAKG